MFVRIIWLNNPYIYEIGDRTLIKLAILARE